MPLVLSVQVKESSLSPEAFRVISKNGVHSTPNWQLWNPPQNLMNCTPFFLLVPLLTLMIFQTEWKLLGRLKISTELSQRFSITQRHYRIVQWASSHQCLPVQPGRWSADLRQEHSNSFGMAVSQGLVVEILVKPN